MKKFLVFILVFIAVKFYAQTGINTSDIMLTAALQIEAPEKDKGIIIPRLTQSQRDAINVSPLDDGLIIYNIDEDCINYWGKQEAQWRSLCGKLGDSEVSFDCNSDLLVLGSFVQGKETTALNLIKLTVQVSKPGDYTISVTSNNGYSFYTAGTFLHKGTFTIEVPAQGIPLNQGIDQLSIYLNGKEIICSPTKEVNVLTSTGTYTLFCKNINVNGVYKEKVPLSFDNTASIAIQVDKLGSWEIKTNTVDGIYFYGSGNFTSTGNQVITLAGIGTPSTRRIKNFNILSNSDGIESSTCGFDVKVVIPKKTIMGIGLGNTYGYNVTNHRASRRLLETPSNYGELVTSKVAFEGFNFIDGGDWPSQLFLETNLLGANPVDIVVIGYDFNMSSEQADIFLQYLMRGGVLLAHCEGAIGNNRLMQTIFNNKSLKQTQVAGADSAGRTYRLPVFDDPLLNGPFGDIRGKNWGDDATRVVYFTNIPSSEIIQYSNSTNANNDSDSVAGSVTAFRHREFNFVWVGEGGFTSQSNDPTATISNNICPFWLNSENSPVPKTTYAKPVYNSVFFANAIAWAIYQAEFNGINTL